MCQSLQISHSCYSYASCAFVFVLEIWLKIRVEDVYLVAASMKQSWVRTFVSLKPYIL